MKHHFRCLECFAVSDTVNWSDTSIPSGDIRYNAFTDTFFVTEGPNVTIPTCIFCGGRATALHALSEALIDISTPEDL